MATILSSITDRAEKSFGKPITKENFGEWVKHWFVVAEQWRDELINEGLVETPETIDRHVAEQKRFCRKYLED